ncbi:uncharacterized protein I303_107207 [Kwoniella dejecticola CBS 10117]|uniref:VHS domain-containing protein n=1 Tax=Kwoniella dejecticola CBS 10117 TaxID=1296121 RepID=A0A1A5ZZ14_9TREE|nr:uncharacterized protein I303_06608 [Kwoniella dejecticola CBS 10117]OBR83049.1 hypothetical protein I303_06608 [Kwoniella dejecticola CBS 10117]
MSQAGGYFKSAMSILSHLEEGKPHSSITDWVEVLSSDRYDELSLDGIPELVESVNIQGYQGTTEAARAIRKKLKYGNVHRQLRALVILRALTENAGKGFQLGWANQQLMDRLKEMANDSLLDPKVKKRLILVFHAWSLHYKDEPRMQEVARLYAKYGGAGPGVKKPTPMAPTKQSSVSSTSSQPSSANRGGFDDDLFSHDWAPSKGSRGPDTYTDLAAAKADADARKREREARILIEQREAEVERRERELRRKQDMAALESRRQKEALEEAERRRQAKEDAKKRGKNPQPKRPPFDFQKEKPQVMVSIANAIQCANNLVNSCRHIDRSVESVLESPKVQDNLDKAKAARRPIIRYIQLVTDEEFVGTLLDANEKIVEAIQLYDRLSKPAVLDSDSEDDDEAKETAAIAKRLAAQKLEAQRTGEIDQLQSRQKKESARQALRRQQSAQKQPARQSSAHPDLADLDFGSISQTKDKGRGLPQPMRPDSDEDSYGQGSLSDYSDYDYNSSDEEWRTSHQSRSRGPSRRQSLAGGAGGNARQPPAREYASLEDEFGTSQGKKGLLDPNDPFGDPFADDNDTPVQENRRMQWAEI